MSTTDPGALEAIALLDEPVRRDLYDWVVRQPDAVGRDDAAAAVGVSRALAAFHLDRLAAAGLLKTEFRRLSGRSGPGAGRPAKLYRRSARELEISLPDRRYGLAAEVFASALERDPGDAASVTVVARDAGVRMGRLAGRGGTEASRALDALAAGGYEPIVDATGAIRLRNCPFHALAERHRSLTCGMNLSLAEGILDGLGVEALSAQLDPQPGWCCVVLRPNAAQAEPAGS